MAIILGMENSFNEIKDNPILIIEIPFRIKKNENFFK